MFLLRLTSSPSLSGVKTDDGFTIGRFSGDTGFLIAATAFLGVIGGLFYLIVRPWIPPRMRAWAMALFGGLIGGALVIRPDGLDFTRLAPLSLAVAMFVALPALYGAVMSVLVERMLREDSMMSRSRAWFLGLLPLIPLALFGFLGLVLLVGMLALWALSRVVPGAASVWSSVPIVWAGRVGLVAVSGLALSALIGDIGRVL